MFFYKELSKAINELTTLYKAIQHYTMLYKTIQHYIRLYNTIRHYTALYKGLHWGPRSPLLCATLCDIGNFQRKVVCVAGRNWATLGDIGQTEQQYPDNVKYYNSQIMHLHRKYNSEYQNII